ncbi:MAG: glycosyltransferase family A protein, partial [Candidatus Onthomorpha sp.]|nr:glycosyltransferase family A protein [Candidatus Onthomorpha sp.]
MGKVSVIIPFYNGVDWLCEAVQSVLDQTYKNFEIIVVNDGSPEDVTKFLEKYGDKIIYHKQINQGPAAAR